MERTLAPPLLTAAFERRYLAALRTRATASAGLRPGTAGRLGLRARKLGIGPPALVRIHHVVLTALDPPVDGARGRRRFALRAAAFLAEALASCGGSQRPEFGTAAEGVPPGRTPDRGAFELAAALRRITLETDRRKVAQVALGTSERQLSVLLARSLAMEEQLRLLSRRLLRSHEEERRIISRELHDAVGQTLAGISVGLANLAGEAAGTPRGLRAEVARTRRLVELSMKTVHRFARDLRPALLDDLGLVPALLSLTREFSRKSGVRVRLSAAEESAGLDGDRRTALFRVAQEALINVDRHAGARNVRVALRKRPGAVRMEVWNDGRSFDPDRIRDSRRNHRLGILCMQERMEMVGGTFGIESSAGKGTTVRAEVPITSGG